MKAIGIDIGTTSICGVIIDTDSAGILKSVTKNSNAFITNCRDFEKIQDVDKIISLAFEILDGLMTEDVKVIGVTGQMHGIVYTDKDGNAVSPLYTWQDERGNQPYKDTTYAKFLSSCTGYGNVTDFYNRENGIRPVNAENYCTIHDYFVMKLCSLKKAIVHSSDGASFGLYDLKTNSFSYDCDIDVTPDYKIAGSYKGIPVSVAIGDNQASVFSTLADENSILVNVGTGSQVSVISDKIVCSTNIETRPYFENKYLLVGAALCGGRAFSMLKDFFGEILSLKGEVSEGEIYGYMDKLLTQPRTSGLCVDTRFAGTRQNTEICGSITNLTVQNLNPAELTWGFVYGMAEELHNMYLEMGCTKSGIVGSGNGIRKNPALARVCEEIFGSKMKTPVHLEEAAFGAALFGLVSANYYKNSKEVQQIIKYC